MKRDAINSTKMKKLSKLLGMPHYAAVGIMEALWHVTSRETPQGDIGKLSNEDIALALGYEGDADKLVEALVECRWIDASEKFRLIVHDWHEHCEDAVDIKLARSLTLYANGSRPRMKRLGVEERAILSAGYLELARDGDKIQAALLCAPVRTKAHNDAQKATESHRKPLPMPKPIPIASGTTNGSGMSNIPVEPTVARLPSSGAKKNPAEVIYGEYPRKVGKRKAVGEINLAIDRIMNGERGQKEPDRRQVALWLYGVVKRYSRSKAGRRGTLTPHPATWFHQSRYLDDPAEWERDDGDGKQNEQIEIPTGPGGER